MQRSPLVMDVCMYVMAFSSELMSQTYAYLLQI